MKIFFVSLDILDVLTASIDCSGKPMPSTDFSLRVGLEEKCSSGRVLSQPNQNVANCLLHNLVVA